MLRDGELERDGMPGAEERDLTAAESAATCRHRGACERVARMCGMPADAEALGCGECVEWER